VKLKLKTRLFGLALAAALFLATLTPALASGGIYTIQKGDSLWSIALKNGTTVAELKRVNGLTSDAIIAGKTLVLPTSGDGRYTVARGDTLWTIARKFATTVAELRRINKLASDVLAAGTILRVSAPSSANEKLYIEYIVRKGDTLGKLAEMFGTNAAFIRELNGIAGDTIIAGKPLKIPAEYGEYTVRSGDTLYKLALAHGTTVDWIMLFSGIEFTDIRVGQILKIPTKKLTAQPPAPAAPQPAPSQPTSPTKRYIDYIVARGDTVWSISVKFGVPMQEVLSDNKLSTESVLNLGQKLKIAQYTVPIKPTPGTKYGEYLDWWTEAQYVVPIGKTVKITDFLTGKSFTIQRTIGAGHADSEPLTLADTNAAKAVFGGYTWLPRAVIVETDGRRIAGSMSFYPHDVSYIAGNGFDGHFDLYFANCIRHVDGKPDPAHQKMVETAAGR
jgi:LysM repeat protein